MYRSALAVALLLASTSIAHADDYRTTPRGSNNRQTVDSCASLPNPGPAFTCVNGQYLPPGHPGIPAVIAPPVQDPPVVPDPRAAASTFKLGRTYQRDASGVVVFVAGAGQMSDGVAVTFLACQSVSTEDHCWYPGAVRAILANATSLGWTELP